MYSKSFIQFVVTISLFFISSLIYAKEEKDYSLSMKNFPFKIEMTVNSEESYALKIINQKNLKSQIINDDIAAFGPLTIESKITIHDYNGDGFLDIAVTTLPAMAGPIAGQILYIFNSKTGEFFESEGIEPEGEISSTRKKGCIRVEYKKNAMDYGTDYYCWSNKYQRWNRLKSKRGIK